MTNRRLTVQGAADALGVSANAVRMRIRRGSLPSERDGEGRVWVLVGPDEQAEVSDQHTTGQPTNEVVEELREQNAYLRELLDAEREARTEENRRKDHIIAGLMQRVPELPESQEPSEDQAQQAPREEPDPEPGAFDTEAHSGTRGPWWRRIFGG